MKNIKSLILVAVIGCSFSVIGFARTEAVAACPAGYFLAAGVKLTPCETGKTRHYTKNSLGVADACVSEQCFGVSGL